MKLGYNKVKDEDNSGDQTVSHEEFLIEGIGRLT